MSLGDRAFQGVSEDVFVPDIRYSIPRGARTVIPGNLACDSRDLGRLMSEGKVVELGSHPRLVNALSTQPRVAQREPDSPAPALDQGEQVTVLGLLSKLQKAESELQLVGVENQRLSNALEESRIECGKLLADGNRLRAELTKAQTEDSKLSAILGKLDKLPAQVSAQSGSIRDEARTFVSDESDVPDFIPSFPTPVSSNMGKPKVTVVDNKGETPGEARRKFRKGKSS